MREYVYNCSSFLSQLRRSRLCIHTHILALSPVVALVIRLVQARWFRAGA